MFCTKCGKETQTGDSFCQYCGAPMEASGPSPAVATAGKEQYQTLVRQTIRAQGKHIFFLITILIYTVAVVCQLFETNAAVDARSAELASEMGIQPMNGNMMAVIVALLPQLATVTALWLIYGGCSARDGDHITKAGFVVLKVVEIVRLVLISLASLLIFIAMLASCSAALNYARAGSMGAVLVFYGMLIGVCVLMLVMSIKTLKIYSVIRHSIDTGSPNSDLSVFVAVMAVIFGGVSVLSVIFDFSCATLLLGVAQIMLGVQIFAYKRVMVEWENKSHLYMSSYIGAYKTDGSVPAWKRIELEEKKESNNQQ